MTDISRIKVQDEVYDIKDALLRHQINVLLGIEPPDERDVNFLEKNSEKE